MNRHHLSNGEWRRMASEPEPEVLALWADTRSVYALFRGDAEPSLLSTDVEDAAYPALSPHRPAAAWFERMVRDLWGHTAIGGADERPLLDHGRWLHSAPMASRPGPISAGLPDFEFAPELDQLPLGPVRPGIEPAAHLRVGLRGETIVRLEARLGYTHKGTLALMAGKSPRAAARFAARLAGEATVAHSIAFAKAAEAASGCEIPPRAVALRELMGQLERIAGSLSVVGATAEIVGRDGIATGAARHEEAIRRAVRAAFGHRLMMDCAIPGGVAADMAPGGEEAIEGALSAIPTVMAGEGRPSTSFPRAISKDDDAQQILSVVESGIRGCRDLLRELPVGAVAVTLPPTSGEGIGSADGPAGEIWHWLRLDHGQIAGVFMCDPSWAKWARLEGAMVGRKLDDLPLIMASLGLSSSATDL